MGKAQNNWYKKQKTEYVVYLITSNGESYIGITTSGRNKTISRLKADTSWNGNKKIDWNNYDFKVLASYSNSKDAFNGKQYIVDVVRPTLNAVSRKPSKKSHKGGLMYKEKWYATKKDLWWEQGKCKYNTFKSRLHRGHTLEEALRDRLN